MDTKSIARQMAETVIGQISPRDIENELEWRGVDKDDLEDMTNEVIGHLDFAQIGWETDEGFRCHRR